MKKDRQKRGTGGLINKKNKFEGRYRVYKKDGTYIDKSFTRSRKSEIDDIKASLRVLGIVDNDVIKIDIDKHTDEIRLIRISDVSSQKIKLDKDIKVNEYVDYWLWNHRRKGSKGHIVKDSTFEDYVQKGVYIKRILGSRTLDNGKTIKLRVRDLTFDIIESALIEFHNEIAHTTAVQTRNHIYDMMRCAKKDGIIKENPLQDETINLPEGKKKSEKKIIAEEDAEKVIKYCLKIWYIDVLTQLITGARGAEIKGLVWTDINIEQCEINFSNNYSSVNQFKLDENNHIVSLGRKRRYSTLKTKTSYRTIKVDNEFMKVLIIHKEMQKRLAEKLKIQFKETDPVFTTSRYGALGRNTLNERVKKVVSNLKVKNWQEITSHCLRHSFCYEGMLNDVPVEYMQKLLGHSDIKTTLKWYAHFDKEKVNNYAMQANANRSKILKEIEEESRKVI